MRIGDARPPPVTIRIEFFPQHPDFAGAIGQQVLARETHGHCKSFGAFANEHDVSGMLHDGLGNHRNILDVAHATHRTSPASGAVHAAGIEFDDSLFIGQAAETDGIIVGIVLGPFHHADSRLERVSATLEKGVGSFNISVAVVGADDDRALRRIVFGGMSLLSGLRERFEMPGLQHLRRQPHLTRMS